jgi:hypothetical protein
LKYCHIFYLKRKAKLKFRNYQILIHAELEFHATILHRFLLQNEGNYIFS